MGANATSRRAVPNIGARDVQPGTALDAVEWRQLRQLRTTLHATVVVEVAVPTRVRACKNALPTIPKVHDETATLPFAGRRVPVEQLDQVVIQPHQAGFATWTAPMKHPPHARCQDLLAEGAAGFNHSTNCNRYDRASE